MLRLLSLLLIRLPLELPLYNPQIVLEFGEGEPASHSLALSLREHRLATFRGHGVTRSEMGRYIFLLLLIFCTVRSYSCLSLFFAHYSEQNLTKTS